MDKCDGDYDTQIEQDEDEIEVKCGEAVCRATMLVSSSSSSSMLQFWSQFQIEVKVVVDDDVVAALTSQTLACRAKMAKGRAQFSTLQRCSCTLMLLLLPPVAQLDEQWTQQEDRSRLVEKSGRQRASV